MFMLCAGGIGTYRKYLDDEAEQGHSAPEFPQVVWAG
jgi:hypothetical protein